METIAVTPAPEPEAGHVSLRPFTDADRPRLDDWARRIGSEAYVSRCAPHPERCFLWWVIQANGNDVGTLWLESAEPQTVILGILLGDPEVFGRGIGSRAIELALDQVSRAATVRTVRLNVRASNRRALACYQRCGFRVVASGTRETLGSRYGFLTMERQVLLDDTSEIPPERGW